MRLRHFKVLGAICRAMDPKTGRSKIGQKRIAALTGMDRRNIRNAIKELRDMGYLCPVYDEKRTHPNGWHKCTIYEVQFEDMGGSHSAMDRGAEKTPRMGGSHNPPTKTITKPSSITKDDDAFALTSPPEGGSRSDAFLEPTEATSSQEEPAEPFAQQRDGESFDTEPPRHHREPQMLLPQPTNHALRAERQRIQKRATAENAWFEDACKKFGPEFLAELPSDIAEKATREEMKHPGAGLEVVTAALAA